MAALIACAADPAALADLACARVAAWITTAIAERGRCRIALAGGSTPRALYTRLATADVDWRRVEVLFGDERCVPAADDNSNYKMACAALLDHVAVAAVHRIEGERPAAEAAARYRLIVGDEPIDVMLLGMGDDGHTASLFPGAPAAEGAAVPVYQSPKPPPERVSLSYATLCRARVIAFLIAGAGKAMRLGQVYDEQQSGSPTLPAARVQPIDGELIWLIDRAAAAVLPAEAIEHVTKESP